MEYLEIFSACIQSSQTKLDVNSLTSFCYELKRKHSEGVKLSNLVDGKVEISKIIHIQSL